MNIDPLVALEGLATRARQEPPAEVSVASSVLSSLQVERPRRLALEPELAWAGLGSLVVAGAALALVEMLASDDVFLTWTRTFLTVWQ